MSKRSLLATATIAALGASQPAMAQQFWVPVFWSSGSDRPVVNPDACPGNVLDLTNVVAVDASHWNPSLTPAQVAQNAADQILSRLYPPPGQPQTITQGRIYIILWGLAHDFTQCLGPGCVPVTCGTETAFFVDAPYPAGDNLPGLTESQFPVFVDPCYLSNKPYRHPFLTNAKREPVDIAQAPPLRQYTQDFVKAYREIQDERLVQNLPPLPDPDGVYLDAEPFMFYPANINNLYMLWWLAQTPDIWNTWEVPGYRVDPAIPSGVTLATLYAQGVADFGFPLDPNDPSTGIEPQGPNEELLARNRPFLNWWYTICQRSIDAVLKNSVYDVIHETWPARNPDGTYKVKCGNFLDSRSDGLNGQTGWFMDRQANPALPRVPSNVFPRCQIEPNRGAPFFHDSTGPVPLRWLGYKTSASGETDQPALYKLSECQAAGCGEEGHRQINQYLPGHPNETLMETTLRLCRHAVESNIESYGGGHEKRQAPWVQFAWTARNPDDVDPGPDVVSPADQRAILAMLRAKNVPEVIYWTNWHPQYQADWYAWAWEVTARVINEVYAARVHTFKRALGTSIPNIGPGNYLDEDDAQDPADPSRLEFTLRVRGKNRTVGIASHPTANATELRVEFRGLNCYAGGGYTLDVPIVYPGFQINLECSTTHPGTLGMIQALDFNTGQWVTVQTTTAEGGTTYRFHAPRDPVASMPGGYQYRTRRTFRLMGHQGRFVSGEQDLALYPTPGTMHLRLIHTSTTSFHSRYDLVQVIPAAYTTPEDPGPSPIPGPDPKQSDMNFDLTVNGLDAALFMESWFAAEPGADANLDDQVDAADLTKFLTSFANESQ